MSETKANIKPEIVALSNLITQTYSLDKAGEVVKTEVKEGQSSLDTVYADNLPEGVSLETISKINDYNAAFIAASGLSLGDASLPVFKANADVTKTRLEIPAAGKDVIKLNFTRETPQVGGEGTTYGSLSAQYDVYADGNRGQLKQVKMDLKARAATLLGS